jgi:N-methylhydantoinase B
MKVDHVTFNVITSAFLAITQEMSSDLQRTAYSTVIREVADSSTFLADGDGRILAQSQNIPLHLNSVSPALQGALSVIDRERLTEDDVIILNDPYNGGQHLSDIYLFSPIVVDHSLVGFSGSVGHYVDLGGSPGFNLFALDVFQERLRFSPMTFSISRDWHGGLFEQFLRSNVRIPRDTIGDMNAQLTANETGRRRFKELVTRYGISTIVVTAEQFLDYAEEQMRKMIARVPDGEYAGNDRVDGDGVSEDPIKIAVRLVVSGSDLHVDFSGTTPQVRTAINCPWASTVSATHSVLKMVLTDPLVPINEGSTRPIHISVPRGSILNPTEFAPVEGRNVVVMRVFQAILTALAAALPGEVPAPGFDTRTEVDLNWTGDRFYAISEQLGGGYGAGPRNDGADQLDDPLGNCKNTPVEALEISQPFFRVTRYELRTDSGGAGRRRGGLGAVRDYEILQDNVHVSAYSDRHRYAARGLFGGSDGTCGSYEMVTADGAVERLPVKCNAILNRGDRLHVAIGGGAGYGDPTERERPLVQQDVLQGKVSPSSAAELYGWNTGGGVTGNIDG